MTKLIHVAVGVVFNTTGQILIALRPSHKLQGDLWEFPGGKIEANETAEQALQRELLEEVGIHISSPQFLVQCEHRYKENHVQLDVFVVREFSGTASGLEGQQINWVTPKELTQLPLLSANHPIVKAILEMA